MPLSPDGLGIKVKGLDTAARQKPARLQHAAQGLFCC